VNNMTSSAEWNVLTTPWMEVMDRDARLRRVSVVNAIRDAADLDQIVAANPLDVFAAYRFLLTLLYWQSPACGGVEKLRKAFLNGRTPRDLLKQLEAESGCFNLFDAKKPFLQDPAARSAKTLPASSLFAEMASGTNVAHFHHGDDDNSQLCLRCAAMGLLRLVPWTQSGGAGKQPAVHGAPPVMPLAMGATLSETFGLNLIPVDVALGKPQWSGQFRPAGKKAGVELLEGLTWNPRRVHLLEPHAPSACSRCGESVLQVVGPIVFEKNPACKQEGDAARRWRDPAAFYKPEDHRTTKSSREADAASGDDVRRLFEQRFGKKTEPAPISWVVAANPSHAPWLVVVPATNPANNKSYDHRAETVTSFAGEAPKRRSRWEDATLWQAADDGCLRPPRSRPPSAGTRRFIAATKRLDAGAWIALAAAAGRSMEEHPAAFDIFTGLYWPLRSGQDRLPSRGAAWMILKLMATAGRGRPRLGDRDGSFRPWEKLEPAASPAKQKRYPRATPAGLRLETELREIIRKAVASNPSTRIDWSGLCQFVHEVTP